MVSVATYHNTPGGVSGRKGLGKLTPLANSFSLIQYNNSVRFLIMDCPTASTIPLYLKEFDRLNVKDVVRVCQPTYEKDVLLEKQIVVHDLPFQDGDVPPSSVIKEWLALVNARVASAAEEVAFTEQPVPTTIAVHCVAGLGRAPVLVAVALIESGMDPLNVIELVRSKRRGAFNNRQITYLADNYKRSSASKSAMRLRQNPLAAAVSGVGASRSQATSAAVTPQPQILQIKDSEEENTLNSPVSVTPKPSFFRKIFSLFS